MLLGCIYSRHFLLKLGNKESAWLRNLLDITQGANSELGLEGRRYPLSLPSYLLMLVWDSRSDCLTRRLIWIALEQLAILEENEQLQLYIQFPRAEKSRLTKYFNTMNVTKTYGKKLQVNKCCSVRNKNDLKIIRKRS